MNSIRKTIHKSDHNRQWCFSKWREKQKEGMNGRRKNSIEIFFDHWNRNSKQTDILRLPSLYVCVCNAIFRKWNTRTATKHTVYYHLFSDTQCQWLWLFIYFHFLWFFLLSLREWWRFRFFVGCFRRIITLASHMRNEVLQLSVLACRYIEFERLLNQNQSLSCSNETHSDYLLSFIALLSSSLREQKTSKSHSDPLKKVIEKKNMLCFLHSILMWRRYISFIICFS